MIWFDPYYMLFVGIPGLLIALWAQAKVRGTFARYSKVISTSGRTGAEAARAVLDANGLHDIGVEATPGALSDHYDPRARVLRLSEPVYGSRSLAALGVAAHEAGHAIQHSVGYVPMRLRAGILPVVALGSKLWMPLAFFSLFMGGPGSMLGQKLIAAAILLLAAVVAFQVVTLPVEYNASRRAAALLTSTGIVTESEAEGAKKVLNAAALTYVAAALQGILTLLYLVSRRRR